MQNKHWIQGDNVCESPLFRRNFSVKELLSSAKIQVCGLGYFILYVNGKRVGNQEFMPAASNYTSVLGCDTTYPVWEERTTYRCFYVTFDLLPYLSVGENIIGIQLGNGWYHQTKRVDEGKFIFGFPKLRYELTLADQKGQETFLESGPETLWKSSEIISNNLFYGEIHDLAKVQEDWCMTTTILLDWEKARPSHAPEAILTEQNCPADKVLRQIKPSLLKESGSKNLYDCLENISGWVSISCNGKKGEKIYVRYSEELHSDQSSLDFTSAGGEKQIQEDCYICNGTPVVVHPKFCWHGFRYFEVEGPGQVISASVVCTDIPVISSFQCSNPILNWLYDAYIRTQINNFHNSIPSDCPHRERLGYTGDGHLTAEVAMMLLDTKKVYDKWYQDILDSQGVDTGHIPHTAPFLGGGGGPGGWGSAIYEVPLKYYQVYGDDCLLIKGFESILRWLEYMHSRCENGLIMREEEGGWCLGDWCVPSFLEHTIPEPFVNTYFYIQGLTQLQQIGFILKQDVPTWIEERVKASKEAMITNYFNPKTEDFCNGYGAANAFALNIGLGSEKTKSNLITKYRTLGRVDTGIFGTPILIERLFQEGESELVFLMLTNNSTVSFARMMESGATTLWEKWDGKESHNHPMFGSVVKHLFTDILGIRQREGTYGFSNYTIEPADIKDITWAEGKMQTKNGTIYVKWERNKEGIIL